MNPYRYPGLTIGNKTEIIIKYICNNNGTTETAVRGQGRQRNLVYIRYILMKTLREKGYTFEKIGELIGRGRCDVMYGIKKFDELKKYPDFQALIIKSGIEL